MSKKPVTEVPLMTTDEEAEAFLGQDLSSLDWSKFKRVHFELRPKTERVNMRFPKQLLDAARARAEAEGIPYQRYIRRAVEAALSAEPVSERDAPNLKRTG
jgi:predicted DNA binding CopG/RHH family protein